MWRYEKVLQRPVKVGKCDVVMAKYLNSLYGGPDGELSAALRYMNHRYSMPNQVIGLLSDIATEELGHLEMIATMIYKLTKNATPEEMAANGLGGHYMEHGNGLFYTDPNGVPHTVAYVQCKGDPITDLYEDIAAEEKARSTYQHLINLSDDPDLIDGLKFLREREIIHSQRFREAVDILKNEQGKKKIF